MNRPFRGPLPVLRSAVAAALVVLGLVATNGIAHWPDVAAVRHELPAAVAVLDREVAAGGAGGPHRWVALRDISPQLQLAVLVAEDIEFFQHRGFSWAEIRLAVSDARAGAPMRGASTITQQLAKNLWLDNDRTVGRKVREAALAVDLERFVGKYRILELYLNVATFGPGVHGAEAAAQRFFGKPPLFLTEAESAQLAAGLSRPSLWHPGVDVPEYRDRVALVRRRMSNAEFLWRHLLRL